MMKMGKNDQIQSYVHFTTIKKRTTQTGNCHGLDYRYPPKAHMLKAWLGTLFDTIGRWWNL
jgi:hypothetical protein